MRAIILGITACAALMVAVAHAQMDFQLQANGNLTVFVVKELVPQENGIPLAKVRLGKVSMRNGTFDRELLVTPAEMNVRTQLLRKKFKLYRGPMKVGVITYEAVPEEGKAGEDLLRALPIDKDAALQALISNGKDQAAILAALNVSPVQAEAAAKNEAKLDEILAKATADEVAALRMGRIKNQPLLFIPVSVRE